MQPTRKGNGIKLKMRSTSPSHFSDLCAVAGVPNPTDADAIGDLYTLECVAAKQEAWIDRIAGIAVTAQYQVPMS